MFIRIVKLSIKEDQMNEFLAFFDTVKEKIRHFEGCTLLEVYQDKKNPGTIFTYSIWKEESDLENYRISEFFTGVWSHIKLFFNGKPEAWSVDQLISLD